LLFSLALRLVVFSREKQFRSNRIRWMSEKQTKSTYAMMFDCSLFFILYCHNNNSRFDHSNSTLTDLSKSNIVETSLMNFIIQWLSVICMSSDFSISSMWYKKTICKITWIDRIRIRSLCTRLYYSILHKILMDGCIPISNEVLHCKYSFLKSLRDYNRYNSWLIIC
jgi:hypothetical protein